MSTNSLRILIETSVVTAGRTLLFFACRHYLLESLYHDLRRLSSTSSIDILPSTPSNEGHSRDEATELDELPPPVTTPRTPSSGTMLSEINAKSERTWHSSISCGIFSLCFSESCTLFVLVLSQALDMFSPRARYINWRLSLGLLLIAILLAAPLQQCLLFTYRSSSRSPNSPRRSLVSLLVFTGVPYCIYLVIFSHIPLPSRLQSSELIPTILSRLVVLGTIILGLLAGFGATSAVFTYFQLSAANRDVVTDARIVASEQSLHRVRSDLLERRRHIEAHRTTENQSEISDGFLSRFNPFPRNSENSSIIREIQGLEALEYQMSRNLEYLQQRRTAALYAGTFRGRIWVWIGKIFALYCVFRVFNSIINVVYPLSSRDAVSTPDLVASLLTRVISVFFPVSELDIVAASRQFSLLLVGAIILTSVRRALRGVTRILKVTSKTLAASLLLLILAQLMGTYLLSTLIQLRTSFPSPSLGEENMNLFATLPEYQVFGPLWDGAFLMSVTVSGAVRWLDDKVNGPGPE